MESEPAEVYSDNKDLFQTTLFDFYWSDNKDPHRERDGTELQTHVAGSGVPSSDSSRGGEKKLSASANHHQPEISTRPAIYLPQQGRTRPGTAVECSSGGGGGGNDSDLEENWGEIKPKKRAVRGICRRYSARIGGLVYHIEGNSSLGETYRSLATIAEKHEFMIKNGWVEVGPAP